MNPAPEPTHADVEAVAAYVSERTGLGFAGRRGPRLRSAVSEAMRRSHSPSGADYRARLEHDRLEFDELVASLTVAESYFFREPRQLDLLRRQILPERKAARPGRVLRFWSAGCSHGEEPYTLAIVLEEAGLASHAEILATDLSVAALRTAEAGIYGHWAVRATTERQRKAYFRPSGAGHQIDARFRRPVVFRRHNLLEPGGPGGPPMDVIFCRNVLIYFGRTAVHRAAAGLASSLAPGGWLVTGSADPPLDVPGLDPVVTPVAVVYRRAIAVADPARERPAAPLVPKPKASRPAPGLPPGAPRSTPPPGRGGPAPAGAADAIRDAGDAGDIGGAVAAAGAAVEQYPLDVELRFLQAVLLLEASRPADAVAAARAAVYLDPALVMGHFVLARAEEALGHSEPARRSLRNAGALLRTLAPGEVVPLSGGEPAGRLAAMAAAQLRLASSRGGSPPEEAR